MAVDEGLAELLREALAGEDGVVEKRMFGGLAFMLRGNMVCGTFRDRGMFRVGKTREAEALALPGTQVMAMGERAMPGMVEALPAAMGDDAVRGRLLALALAFTGALPAK
jgi:TfoX/Sxy family transcriptional regulator of competence genes